MDEWTDGRVKGQGTYIWHIVTNDEISIVFYIIVPTITSHLELVHEKERYIAQLTRKLHTFLKRKKGKRKS